MNQILFTKPDEKKKKHFILVFVLCIFLCIAFFLFYFYREYQTSQKEKLSQSFLQSFHISTLYSNSIQNEYSAEKLQDKTLDSDPFVIGMIEIKKIGLTYPILSYTNADLLKISPCRLAGPMPNQVGNLCIAGHNYVDNRFFSKLHLLQVGDEIFLYDLSGSSLSYTVFEKTEVSAEDLSCLSQETNGEKYLTLITCNNVTGKRVIVKAKETI